MGKFSTVVRLPEFNRDLKKLSKRFRTLESDLATFIEAQLQLYHKKGIDNKGIFRIPGLRIGIPVYKARKFACRSLKGTGSRSGIRVIYTYYEKRDKIELIEIFYKGDKENEDRDRILEHYRKKR